MYNVEFTESSIKQMKKLKLDFDEFKMLLSNDLQENPEDRGKFYARSRITGLLYFEKRYYRNGGLRFFYTVSHGTIIISDVEYDGRVIVRGSANKKSQDKLARDLGLF